MLRLIIFLFGILISATTFAQTARHPDDETIRYLSNPKFTKQQILFIREISADPYLESKSANFFDKSLTRFRSMENKSQNCMIGQYMTYQDIDRSNWSMELKSFAKENLKKEDWCYRLLKTMNVTVSQAMSFDGLITIYYVLARDMELRLKSLESQGNIK